MIRLIYALKKLSLHFKVTLPGPHYHQGGYLEALIPIVLCVTSAFLIQRDTTHLRQAL